MKIRQLQSIITWLEKNPTFNTGKFVDRRKITKEKRTFII